MPLKTLCGLFDEPVKTTKKNFIKENIKSIKQLQEILHVAQRSKENTKTSLDRNVNKKPREKLSSVELRKASFKTDAANQKDHELVQISKKPVEKTLQAINKVQNQSKLKNYKTTMNTIPNLNKPQCSTKSVQTDTSLGGSCGDVELQTEESVIKQQDSQEEVKDEENLGGGFHVIKNDFKDEPTGIPFEPNCPPGHVLLSEEERVETLKTLRQNYEKLIFSLNSLSITCDTLRIRKRRIQLEDELRDTEEAIKVFDRPKVYIKE
ncbi:uncharacterized protein LOC130451526 [Diorhabda sublineata]|uniref:uncharacterized protein LOC130451526 n=1 Tax=Diorhabda sublineata TaxID=1163346 RepID=UPI0024E0CBA3|nr:uncharacterized protein LOC130451526 [Diorhabda sublineata]